VADIVRAPIAATRPDVAVLDVRPPDGSGLDVCRTVQATQPKTRCLILTVYGDDQALYTAVIPGAAGYVLKDFRSANLIADGPTNREIGESMALAEKTVKNYVSGLLSKLGLQRRTQAVLFQLESRDR
jgi:DNA-binding NarL/FixJ family response regulator